MKKMRTIVLLIAALSLVAAACGDDGDGAESIGDYTLVTAGTLTVCTDSPYPPMEFEVDGEFTGFDIELMREIAGELSLELALDVVIDLLTPGTEDLDPVVFGGVVRRRDHHAGGACAAPKQL